jgi:hypothetical protein
MAFLALIARLILIGLVSWLVGRFLSRLFSGGAAAGGARAQAGPGASRARAGSGNSGAQKRPVERLVRDPVCGVALPLGRAIADDGEHFCSVECRDARRAERRSAAAV